MPMETYFHRVKSVIDRLREILRCQICCQLKEEKLMQFYHMCDHFYCVGCLESDKLCPICKNPGDTPTCVLNDNNILSLYKNLAKFQLPSKQDVDKILKNRKESKTKLGEIAKECENLGEGSKESKNNLGESSKQSVSKEIGVEEKGLILKEKEKKELTSPEGGETASVSSKEPPKMDKGGECVGRRRKHMSVPRKRSCPTVSDSTKLAKTSTPETESVPKQSEAPPTSSGESAKGKKSLLKANVNKKNAKGETQLHLACKKSNFVAMADLVAAGANPNAQDNAGWTPLHESVFSGNIEVMKFLLKHGADVNLPGLENTTALHEAIAKENVPMVRLLLDNGADVYAKNIFRETPLDLVTKYRIESMREPLSTVSSYVRNLLLEMDDHEEIYYVYSYNLSPREERLVDYFLDKFEGETVIALSKTMLPSHIVISTDNKIQLTWALISTVSGAPWVVTSQWVDDSLMEELPKPAAEYEPPLFSGFARARANNKKKLPKLFTGCYFFFGGNFEDYTFKNLVIGKESLKTFVEENGGLTLKRSPKPECLIIGKSVPYHASPNNSIGKTSYFVIYQTEKWDPVPKYNMSHIKTLPVEWLVCCILKFDLLDPKDRSWTLILKD